MPRTARTDLRLEPRVPKPGRHRYHGGVTVRARAHRRVLGLYGDVEVLVCGHEVPRFDRTAGFGRLTEQRRPAHPRLRRCPGCPEEQIGWPAALAEVSAPGEALTWWARLSLPERCAWLDGLAAGDDTTPLRRRGGRSPLPARERDLLGGLLRDAHRGAEDLGLSLRELSSCSAAPLPTLSGWALARAAARRYEASSPGLP